MGRDSNIEIKDPDSMLDVEASASIPSPEMDTISGNSKGQVPTEDTLGDEYDRIPGMAIALGRAEFWALENKKVYLNRLVGKISQEVPRDVNQDDRMIIAMALKVGEIIEVERVLPDVKLVPTPAPLTGDMHIRARRLLDEKNKDIFSVAISKTLNLAFLGAAVDVEMSERNRSEYITILTARIKELAK